MIEPTNALSVLVPVYNEAGTIGRVLARVLDLGPLVKEVIVIDDGSTDATAGAVRAVARTEPRVRFRRHDRNAGKTAAVRTALAMATGPVVIVQDADLEYDPAEIPAVVAPILAGEADVVFGSRFMARGTARVPYYTHTVANAVLTCLCNLFTNRAMTDVETGYKAFRRDVIAPLELTSRGFGMEVEIAALVSRTRARLYEVPITYHPRAYDEGKKIGVRDGIAALWYIAFYNLVKPRLPAGRRYVAAVNEALAERAVAEAPAMPTVTPPPLRTLPRDVIAAAARSGRHAAVTS